MKTRKDFNIITYKNRIKTYCDYSNYVSILSEKLFLRFPDKIIPDNFLRYACIFLVISKFMEDNLLSLYDYSLISGFKTDVLIKNEFPIVKEFLRLNYLNLPRLVGIGTNCSDGPDTKELGGFDPPDTLESPPPGVKLP
jgi:hypothetical protein